MKGEVQLKFTIDIAELIGTTHRLKKDGNFKRFEGQHDKDIHEDDFTFDNYYEAKIWKTNHEYIEVDGSKIPVNPTSYSLGDPYIDIRPHRTEKPKQSYFDEDQLREVILNGDDSYNNSLVVDFDGYLHLVPFKRAVENIYAVRFETFVAGNGYVGNKTSLEGLEETYLSLLDGWSTHLIGHNIVYRDYPSNQTKEELIAEIQETIKEM